MNSLTFYLVRHGQTDWNLQKRLQGTNDIPLNETGRGQARALRKFFEHHPVDAWFSSPLSRALETLMIATEREAHQIVIEPGLMEVGLGALEGTLWSGGGDAALPGAEEAESSNSRFRASLIKLSRAHSFTRAAVCTHGFLLRRFLQELAPVDPPRVIANGLIAEVRLTGEQLNLVKITTSQ